MYQDFVSILYNTIRDYINNKEFVSNELKIILTCGVKLFATSDFWLTLKWPRGGS